MRVFKVIKSSDNAIESYFKYGLIISLIAFLIGIIFELSSIWIISFIIIWALITAWILLKQIGVMIKYSKVGTISLDSIRIAISSSQEVDRNFRFDSDSLIISVSYYGYKGMRIGRNYCYGDKNYFLIKTGTETIKCIFLLENINQRESLVGLLEDWKKNGIAFTENNFRGRSILN